MTLSNLDRIMTTDEAAAYLSVKPSWLLDRRVSLGIPAYRVGRQLRYRQTHLDQWLDAQQVAA